MFCLLCLQHREPGGINTIGFFEVIARERTRPFCSKYLLIIGRKHKMLAKENIYFTKTQIQDCEIYQEGDNLWNISSPEETGRMSHWKWSNTRSHSLGRLLSHRILSVALAMIIKTKNCNIFIFHIAPLYTRKLIGKSRECHKHKSQQTMMAGT